MFGFFLKITPEMEFKHAEIKVLHIEMEVMNVGNENHHAY